MYYRTTQSEDAACLRYLKVIAKTFFLGKVTKTIQTILFGKLPMTQEI